MPATSFKGYNIVEFSFANKLSPGSQIQLENKYQFNVKYAANNTCMGEMTIKVADRSNPDNFFVNLLLRGVFTFTPGTAREDIHIEAHKTLFPYARAYISTVTAAAGIPPIIIPEVDIESQSIYRFDLKPKDS
ncbi:MAG: protein-export chaperone SecB [Eubacteriales bacterium]|jgi:preprotein translocase subunit SecB